MCDDEAGRSRGVVGGQTGEDADREGRARSCSRAEILLGLFGQAWGEGDGWLPAAMRSGAGTSERISRGDADSCASGERRNGSRQAAPDVCYNVADAILRSLFRAVWTSDLFLHEPHTGGRPPWLVIDGGELEAVEFG